MATMKRHLKAVWHEQDGVLSFEWVVLLTLLAIGIVGGIAAARDAIVDELGDAAQGMVALDGTYSIDYPLLLTIDGESTGMASDSGYVDAALYADCLRDLAPAGQVGQVDTDS